MIGLADRFTDGVQRVIDRHALPWHVVQLGARAEYAFLPEPPPNGGDAAPRPEPGLEEHLHPVALNRRLRIAPLPNMALMSPAAAAADLARHPGSVPLAPDA